MRRSLRLRAARSLACSIVALHQLCCASPVDETPVASDLEGTWQRYAGVRGPKALAAAVGATSWAYGIGKGATEVAAQQAALRSCEEHRAAHAVEAPCSLRLVNDEDVWSLSDALVEFDYYRPYKALWIAGNADSHVFGYVRGAPDQAEANALALRRCHDVAAPLSVDFSCRICVAGEGVPCNRLEPGWE